MGCCKLSKSPHLTTRILKVYIEALTEFSHMYYPDDLSNTLLSQVTPSVRMVGFISKRSYIRKLVLGCCKLSKSPHLTTRILKVYIEALTEFSHMYYPDDLSNTLLSQVTPSVRMVGGMYIPRTGKGTRRLQLLRSSSRVNHWSCPLNDCPQQRPTSTKYHKHL